MSKVHILLILLIMLTLGASVYLLKDEVNNSDTKAKKLDEEGSIVFDDQRSAIKRDGTKEYVQGALVLPDLNEGFKRCLSRGYNNVQLSILKQARDTFEDENFDEGSFSWNKVIYIDQYGDKNKLFLGQDLKLTISKELEDGSYKEVETQILNELSELKDLLEAEQVLINEYAQAFKKDDLKKNLILKDGVMKSLEIISPKKRVVCKP